MPLTKEINFSNSVPLESCANITSPSESETNYDRSQKRDKRDGPVFDEDKNINSEHFNAICAYCGKFWHRSKPAILKSHLALYCQSVPENICQYWHNKLIDINTVNKKNSQLQLALPPQVSTKYDKILLRAWVMANILFEVIENPYIKNLFKSINPAYNLLLQTILSGWLLDEEVAHVQNNIDKDLKTAEYLTLNLLYNYIVTTMDQKEYLVSLHNYSIESHTGNFIASEIMDIIEQIGPQKFAAIVTDSAQQICQKSMKLKVLLANACPTCWGSHYNTTNSILLARPVFDWIFIEHSHVITNIELIKTCINILEAGSANLADCYINMIKLAAIIYQIPEFNHLNYYSTISKLWRGLGYFAQKYKELILQFYYYDANKKPFDLFYVQGLDMAMLWWGFIKNKRTCFGVEKLEEMAKIRAYHIANIQSELTCFDAKLTEFELYEMVKIATIDDYIADEEEICRNNDSDNIDTYEESSNLLCQTIILKDIVNLWDPVFQDREVTQFEFFTNIADTNIDI
ncbi:32142_t:CDS:2 [Gigaspora margarita]|uniref:32142_t:CDS:1 n=1 Tax=Gigaspora margarita TaxID=4874 RepID=A0ABN7VSE1_GIGMA|nr:32142_t:CDS:2 [Gigaspora margarita]